MFPPPAPPASSSATFARERVDMTSLHNLVVDLHRVGRIGEFHRALFMDAYKLGVPPNVLSSMMEGRKRSDIVCTEAIMVWISSSMYGSDPLICRIRSIFGDNFRQQ